MLYTYISCYTFDICIKCVCVCIIIMTPHPQVSCKVTHFSSLARGEGPKFNKENSYPR